MNIARKHQLWRIITEIDAVSVDEEMHYLGTAGAFSEETEENDQCLPVALFHDLVEDKYISMDELATTSP